jgi:hypothetical protein
VDTRGRFWGVSGRSSVKLTTHLHLVPRSRMRGAIPPFPQYAFMAWCSVKAQGKLYLFYFINTQRTCGKYFWRACVKSHLY